VKTSGSTRASRRHYVTSGLSAARLHDHRVGRRSAFTHEVAGSSFALDYRADAMVKRIFALHWNAGSDVNRARVTLARKPAGDWSSVFEFEYDD
jgi:hypothetical protein